MKVGYQQKTKSRGVKLNCNDKELTEYGLHRDHTPALEFSVKLKKGKKNLRNQDLS